MPSGGHNCKSVEEHKANGTYRPSRHGRPTRSLNPTPIEKPNGLSKEVDQMFDRIVSHFEGSDWLTALDCEFVLATCQIWDLAQMYEKMFWKDPRDADARRAYISYLKLWNSFAGSLGIRPVDRRRYGLSVNDNKENPNSLFQFTRKR